MHPFNLFRRNWAQRKWSAFPKKCMKTYTIFCGYRAVLFTFPPSFQYPSETKSCCSKPGLISVSKYSLFGIFPQPRSSDIFFIAALSLISVFSLLDPTYFGLFQTWGADLPPSFSFFSWTPARNDLLKNFKIAKIFNLRPTFWKVSSVPNIHMRILTNYQNFPPIDSFINIKYWCGEKNIYKYTHIQTHTHIYIYTPK